MEEDKLINKKKYHLTKGNKLALASVCNDLAELYTREGKYELAKNEYLNEAKLYKELDKPILYARANRMIGEICTTLAEFDEAIKYENIHLEIAKSHKNELEEQRALASIGRTYLTKAISDPDNLDSDSLTLAHTSFLQSLSLCEGLKNISKEELMDMKARLYLNLGVVKEHFGDFERGEEFMTKSILLCKKYEIYDQQHHGHYTLGLLHSKSEDYRKAITNFNYALDIADRLSDKIPPLCATYAAKADVLIKLGEFSSAKHVLIKAYKLQSPNIGERYSIEHNLKIVAAMCLAEDTLIITPVTDYKKRKQLYEKMGDGAADLKVFDKAIDYYNKMLECAIACGDTGKDLVPVYVSLAQTFKDNKQYKMAYEYFQKDYAISRSNPEECYKTLINLAVICELNKMSYEDVACYYERARKEARATNKMNIEGKVISQFIKYKKKMKKDAEAAKLQEELDMMDYESSDSDSDGEDSGGTPNIGNEINISDLLELDDVSDEEKARPTRRRGRHLQIKKNAKGETQLHSACIRGNLSLAMSLIEKEHPVNIRDYCGWLPIHEACNYGHTDIVRFLISKGGTINDRGGTECEGTTPLHSACANGHLDVIELMLDNGASPIAQVDTGETPLDYLKAWRENQHLDPIKQTFYETLVSRMSTALEKVGRSVTPKKNHIFENNDALYINNTNNTSRRYNTRGSPTKSPSISPKISSPYGQVGGLRYSVDVEDDLNKPSCSGLKRHSSLNENSIKSKSNSMIRTLSFASNKDSSDESDSPACNEYKRAIEGLRSRIPDPKTKSPKTAKKSTSAFLSDEEAANEWLDDDININQPKRRKRGSNTKQNFLESTGTRNTYSSYSKSPNVHELSLGNDENTSPDVNKHNGYESGDSINSVSSNKRKRSQTSLLESGFSRRSGSPLNTHNFNSSPVNIVDKISNKTYKRQQKLSTFVSNYDNSEPDSTTQQMFETSLQNTIIPLLAINVRIENKLWRIPVQANEVNVLTIEWLAKEAAKRYYKQEGISPTLQLMSKEGAILVNEDPLSMVFISPTQAEEVQSNIVNWNLPPLPERYVEACCSFKIDPSPQLRKSLDDSQGTLNLKLDSILLNKDQLPPLFRALNRQNNLQQLDISDNNLLNEGVQQLCFALSSLVQLRSLNLSRNNLTGEGIRFLSETFTKTEQPILVNLSELNLSYNLFGDDTLRYLGVICGKLKLRNLNLSGCSLPEDIFKNVFNHGVDLNFTHLEICDLSYNDLNTEDIIKFISFLNFSNISNLNVSHNTNVSESGITKNIAENLSHLETNNMKSLNLAKCKVNDSEIWELLRTLTKSQDLDSMNLSFNNDITAVSLRRLLQHRPSFTNINLLGCANIVQYFEEFAITPGPTKEMYQVNTLKNLTISIHCEKNSQEADFLVRTWEREWGRRAKVKKMYGRKIQFSVEN